MASRSNILPDPRFAELSASLAERLERVAESIRSENFAALLDPLMRQTLHQGFTEAGAHEGTIWLVDESGEHLAPMYNTGPNADRLVGKFRQPLASGLICMVFSSEQPFLENEVQKNGLQSKLLDTTLGVQTYALIAVPFYFLKACRGVISCVQLTSPQVADAPGFTPENLGAVLRTGAVLSRLLDFRLISQTIGWSMA